MFKRKQWVSAVRRGRKHAKYDEDAVPPVGSVVDDKEELEEEPSGRREDETNTKMRIMKKTRKRKKGDCCSGDILKHRPSPLEEFSDSDIDLDCNNEKEEEQHHVYFYNPPRALLTTITPSFSMPRPLIESSSCCHHDDKDTSKCNYDEYSSASLIPSSGFSSSPSHSPIHSFSSSSFSSSPNGKRKKRGKYNNNRAGKNLKHRRPYRMVKKGKGGGRKGFSKRTKRRIILMAAVGIKLLIALLLTTPL